MKTLNVTEKTGKLVAIKDVSDTDELMIINKSGLTIRMLISDLRVMGRATQGVRLIKLNEGDEISSVAKIERMAGEEPEVEAVKPLNEPLEGEELMEDDLDEEEDNDEDVNPDAEQQDNTTQE